VPEHEFFRCCDIYQRAEAAEHKYLTLMISTHSFGFVDFLFSFCVYSQKSKQKPDLVELIDQDCLNQKATRLMHMTKYYATGCFILFRVL
jgi:hypothetical protein